MNLIIVIIIFYFVIKHLKAKNAKQENNAARGTAKRSAETFLGQRETMASGSRSSTAGSASKPARSGAQQTQAASTMDYLAQKAKEGRIEHALEKRREEQRLRSETGGRKPALRYYYGDSVPPKMRIVKCGYCGAENLVPERVSQENYTCYFCRENL